MAKTFNFGSTPAAKEINGEMQTIAQPQPQPEQTPTFARRDKDKLVDWTLTQCRLPNNIHARMKDFCFKENISINEFITVAVKELLKQVK